MWKRIVTFIGLLGLVSLLASCQPVKITAKEATELFIQGEFYLTDSLKDPEFTEKYRQAFSKEITAATETRTRQELETLLSKSSNPSQESGGISEQLETALLKKTSFETSVTKTTENEVTIKVAVKGINQQQLVTEMEKIQTTELLDAIHKAGFEEIKEMSQLAELASTSEVKEITKLVEEVQSNPTIQEKVISEALTKAVTQTKATTVEFQLISGTKDQPMWRVKDEAATIRLFAQALLN